LSMTMRGMFPHPAHSSPVLGRMLRCAQHDNEGNVSAPSQIVTGSWADASGLFRNNFLRKGSEIYFRSRKRGIFEPPSGSKIPN
ncbi:MAG: hypothetical protein LLG42_13115, partial [Chloroflexi bacterium]|nr:hypothetical protein [Chloroflexota bacterium]